MQHIGTTNTTTYQICIQLTENEIRALNDQKHLIDPEAIDIRELVALINHATSD